MTVSGPSVTPMTWWDYVERHRGDDTQAAIAEKVGITPPSIGRWRTALLPELQRRPLTHELGISQTRLMQTALRLASDPAVQAEHPELCATVLRRRDAARARRSAAVLR